MIKRIIFDLDDTLIMWESKYVGALISVLENHNIKVDDEVINKFDEALNRYEENEEIFEKNKFNKYMKENFCSELDDNFYDLLVEAQKSCYKVDDELEETLKYLKNKYDLVVLSNWFSETQRGRLENAGLLKYFTFVSGGDERVFKPDLKAFDICLEGYQKDEVVMVGDSYACDIVPAKKLGIKYYWVTDEINKEENTIKNVNELRELL